MTTLAEVDACIARTPKTHVPTVAVGLRARGYLVSQVERGAALLYRRDDGPTGSVKLAPYCTPILHADTPLIWRWHVDHYSVRMPVRAYAELGLDTPRDCWRRAYWECARVASRHLELSCLPSEVDAFANWLPTWIDARDRGVPHPDPAVPMSRPGDVLSYAWSAAGWDVMERPARARRR